MLDRHDDIPSAIAAANSRFGTSFIPYERTEANEAWCRTFVVEADRVDQGEVRESTVALPQAARHRDRQPIVDRVLSLARPVGDVDPLDPHARGPLFRGTVCAGPPDRFR